MSPDNRGRRAHRLLAQLADQPASRRDLEHAEPSPRDRRKLPYLLAAMVRDGLILKFRGVYEVTNEGLALLDHLDERENPRAQLGRAA